MNPLKYRYVCTLSFGDIYGQIIIWLIVLFAGLASALALMSNPLFALVTVGIILVVSVPFLLFAFVTTLINHIEFVEVSAEEKVSKNRFKFPTQVAVESAAVGG